MLALFKSRGERRFGWFTSEPWRKRGESKKVEHCFTFSLDTMKICPHKDYCDSIYSGIDYVPVFYGDYFDIKISDSSRKGQVITQEANSRYGYEYNGDDKVLSIDSEGNGTPLLDCEL